MSTEFEKLVKFVERQTKSILPEEQIRTILSLDEEAYQRDSPLSIGKSLEIISIEFKGLKGSGVPIHYSRKFELGVNLWVGDNLVGKSSIFNIAKLALTGSNGISKDVLTWLQEIWVEFGLGLNQFTVHVSVSAQVLKQASYEFRLYSKTKQAIAQMDEVQRAACLLFEGGIGRYEEYVRTFFFKELDYYSLQWTQHSSKKDDPNLLTSNATWKTYFKSIYLEANDYDVLFYGQQSELIFQMLLGLELTYPINRLKIKKENLQNKLGLLKAASTLPDQHKQEEGEKLSGELKQIQSRQQELEKERQAASSTARQGLERKIEGVRQKYRDALTRINQLEKSKQTHDSTTILLEREIRKVVEEIKEFDIEITKRERRITNLQEQLEIGGYFSSLEIRTCPGCSHQIEKSKMLQEKETGHCRLCDHEIERQPIDLTNIESQLKQLEIAIIQLKKDQYNLKIKHQEITAQIKNNGKLIGSLNKDIELIRLPSILDEITALEKELNQVSTTFDLEKNWQESLSLASRRGVLEEKLKGFAQNIHVNSTEQQLMEHQIKVLDVAREELQRIRAVKSQKLLHQFEALYLKKLHAFGLYKYEKIEVAPTNFRVSYRKNSEDFSFDEISPGEKLRAKLGLYIALIEMDVEYQFGRHPRFIILDSPAKEEGDQPFIEGLKDTLAYIEREFGKQLQVFVGTAQRELTNAVDASKVEVRREKEYFF